MMMLWDTFLVVINNIIAYDGKAILTCANDHVN